MIVTRRRFVKTLGSVVFLASLQGKLSFGRSSLQLESFDSGTRIVREVAESLTGRGRSILEAYPPGSEIYLWLLSLFPEGVRIAGIELGMALGVGEHPKKIDSFAPQDLLHWCISQYPKRSYRAIMIGSPNGAIAHIAALLEAPFLCSSFGISFRRPQIKPEDLERYHQFGQAIIERLKGKVPGFEIINHYDPIHDRNLVKFVNRIRLKLRVIPQEYRAFIRENLEDQGTVILVNCRYPWWQYQIGEGIYVQIGGLGGISSEEFVARWPLEAPLVRRPESEWGCPQDFADSVREFCSSAHIRLLEVALDHPEHYSLLAYQAYLRCQNVRREEILIDCFNHQNPRTNIITGIPGLWVPFNTTDSLEFARGFMKDKKFKKIYFTVLPSFAQTPDTPPLKEWFKAFQGRGELKLLGVNPRTFPADPLAPFGLVREMRRLRYYYRLPKRLTLSVEDFQKLLTEFTPARSALRTP